MEAGDKNKDFVKRNDDYQTEASAKLFEEEEDNNRDNNVDEETCESNKEEYSMVVHQDKPEVRAYFKSFQFNIVENPILEEINFQFSVYWEQETLVPGDRLRASRSRREQWYSSADAGWPAGDSALSLEWIRVQELFDQSQ